MTKRKGYGVGRIKTVTSKDMSIINVRFSAYQELEREIRMHNYISKPIGNEVVFYA